MHKKRIVFLAWVFGLLWLAATAVAQPALTATLKLETSAPLTVGDPLPLTLRVTHPAGYRVVPPQFDGAWGDLTVQAVSAGTTAVNDDGGATTTLTLDARLFAPGDFQTPPLDVSVTDGAGNLFTVTAAPIPLTIQSVLVEGDTELRDIKPQAVLPYTNVTPWLVGGVVLALSAVSAWLFWRRYRARLALVPLDTRLPHEVALDELGHIEQMGLPQQGRFKEHYTLTADTLRRYLERAYHIPVIERTTGEIRAALQTTTMPTDVAQQVVAFLDASDLIKFSQATPSVAGAQQLLAQARRIVSATQPSAADDSAAEPHPSASGRLHKMEMRS